MANITTTTTGSTLNTPMWLSPGTTGVTLGGSALGQLAQAYQNWPAMLPDTRPLQQRLDERRQRAEKELITIARLQQLVDALPEGTEPAEIHELLTL